MFSSADVAALVGPGAMGRGLDYVAQGRVVSVARSGDGSRIVGHVEGSRRTPYVAVIEMSASGNVPRDGRCSCPVARNCKHVAATLLAYRQQGRDGGSVAERSRRLPDWEVALAPLLDDEPDAGSPPSPPTAWDPYGRPAQRVGLQVDLVDGTAGRGGSVRFGAPRLALRPVVMGARGRWVRTGISWRELRYHRGEQRHLEVLRSMYGLATGARGTGYGFDDPTWIHADEMPGSAFWALLDDARRDGLAIVDSDKAQTRVGVGVARSTLQVVRADDGLRVMAAVTVEPPTDHRTIPVGNPAGGVVVGGDPDGGPLALARLITPLDEVALDLATRRDALWVPAEDEARFLGRVLPVLAERFDELHLGDGVALPEPPRPMLVLQVTRFAEHRVRLVWQWRYVTGEPPVADAVYGLASVETGARGRDAAREADVLARLAPALGREVRDVELRGIATAGFFTEELPGLVGLASRDADLDVEVFVDADAGEVEYRVASDVEVSVELTAPAGGRDWFDLGVLVHVDGRSIPFSTIFTALATGQTRILLPDGLHFSLDDERFDALREILDEARELQDGMGETLRVGRYQAELFDALDRLGVLDEQADAWRKTLGALAGGARPEHVDVPVGLDAELRSYQREGFEWLVFLAEHGLGGVLADDMGLGKTVQTLAAVQHAHEKALAAGVPRPAPVLVVAPTSVVDNWLAEARRFTPGLRTVAIRETAAKRRTPLGDALLGDALPDDALPTDERARVDVVVTSYALFRLDADEYQGLEWSALILDEAQFVKNRQSVAYRCARTLPAPVKLALTGTPLENNLMELWSILSIVSPGLFPDPNRFADHYAGPIEREGDAGRLELLRRRVAPFLLRRTKEDVARDLPARQEQVTEVTLQPRHRRIYDQYLQRERKNVLGLVDKLDSHRFKVFRSLTVLRQASLDVSLVDEAHAGVPSSKLDVLFEMLDDILAEGHSVLIFSQFTRYLGRVRDRLGAAGIPHAYLDGRTRKRAEAIERFTSGEVPVFLVSLKAGGFGLNLTAADYCILLDPWWNPAAEAQAVDRAHRIGQTRQVMVYRLVAADTIEDKVMSLKAAKSKLFASVLDGGTSAASGITADDVRALLE